MEIVWLVVRDGDAEDNDAVDDGDDDDDDDDDAEGDDGGGDDDDVLPELWSVDVASWTGARLRLHRCKGQGGEW